MSTRPQFHRLTIQEVRRETADAISVAFAVPEELRPDYVFSQGQFLTIKATVDGEVLRRSYSVCVPTHAYTRSGELRVAIKAVTGGRFSHFANTQFKAGQTLEVMTPDGRFFTPLSATNAKHYVGFAGGSGITPLRSMIETTLAAEPLSRFTLVYGNRGIASILFAEALEQLKNRYLTRFALYHVLSDAPQEVALFSGLLDQAKCREFLTTLIPPATIDEAFICGPGPMMDGAEAALKAAGVDAAKIHIERFGTPLPFGVAPAAAVPAKDDAPTAEVHIIIDGNTRVLQMPPGVAILDQALKSGADLPFACKAGVCCTCRAKVLEGSVRMEKNYTLEANEVAQGYVLTCQARPTTAKVVVSFDER